MRTRRTSLVLVLLVTLAACTSAPTATLPPSPTAAPPTPTPAPSATATLAPATPTAPAPTATLRPSAMPSPTTMARATSEGPLTVQGQALRALVLVPGSPVRYGLLPRGLTRSDDGGKSWQQVSNLPLPVPLVSPHDPRTLYAGNVPSCYRGDDDPLFRRSTDGGVTWQELPQGRGIKPIAVHPGPARTLYGISCAGLHTSRDGGQTWQLTGPTRGWDITDIVPTGSGRLLFLAVLTSEGGSSHLAWFDEEGRLSQDLAQGLTFWGKGKLSAEPGGAIYVAEATGVYRSSDGQRWSHLTDGLADVILSVDPLRDAVPEKDWQRGYGLFALAPDPANPRRLALGTIRGLYISQDGGDHWRPAGIEALATRRIDGVTWDAGAPGTLYATTSEGVYVVRLP